jgi:uncharacterized protein (DUF1810 family)
VSDWPAVTGDPYDLERFVVAQAQARTYESAVAELRAGAKRSHWIWFVFPQIAGLGRSDAARRYAIGSLDEARAFAAHPVLGPRLRECAALMLEHRSRPAAAILGEIDAVKLRSSMTLFARAMPQERVFMDVIRAFFAGEPDHATDKLLPAA